MDRFRLMLVSWKRMSPHTTFCLGRILLSKMGPVVFLPTQEDRLTGGSPWVYVVLPAFLFLTFFVSGFPEKNIWTLPALINAISHLCPNHILIGIDSQLYHSSSLSSWDSHKMSFFPNTTNPKLSFLFFSPSVPSSSPFSLSVDFYESSIRY